MKIITYRYIACFILFISITSCGSNKTQEKSTEISNETTNQNIVKLTSEQIKQIDLQIEETQKRKISSTLKLSGEIDVPPQNLISISAYMGGYLKSSNMLPGTKITKGQLLAVMEDPQYIQLQQEYLSTKSKLNYALKEYIRQKELNSSLASSDKVLQQAENDYSSLNILYKSYAAKLKLIGISPDKLTENNISNSINIYAPISGYVSKVLVNIGKYVTPSEVIFELVNPTDIHLNLTVFEKDLSKLSIGQEVLAYSNGNPSKKYRTEVILVGHALNADRSAEIHCHFEDYDNTLTPGMYMNAEVQLTNSEENTLPDDAIVSFENKYYVFIQKANQEYEMIEIKKGNSERGFTAIKTDLLGKKIVVKGAYSLLMKLKNTGED